MRTQRTIPGILAAVFALSACGGDEGPTAIEIPLASVEIVQSCANIIEGTTCQMAARGMTAEGQIVTNAVMHWSSNAPSVAQVSSAGRVLGIAAGKATITVEAALGQGEDTTEVFVFRSAPK